MPVRGHTASLVGLSCALFRASLRPWIVRGLLNGGCSSWCLMWSCFARQAEPHPGPLLEEPALVELIASLLPREPGRPIFMGQLVRELNVRPSSLPPWAPAFRYRQGLAAPCGAYTDACTRAPHWTRSHAMRLCRIAPTPRPPYAAVHSAQEEPMQQHTARRRHVESRLGAPLSCELRGRRSG